MDSDFIIEEGELSCEKSEILLEHLVPLEQNQRQNRYGSIICEESEAEDLNSVRPPEAVVSQ